LWRPSIVSEAVILLINSVANMADEAELNPMFVSRYPAGAVAVEQVAIPQAVVANVKPTFRAPLNDTTIIDEPITADTTQAQYDNVFDEIIRANHSQAELDHISELRQNVHDIATSTDEGVVQ
jgi:hypothetical protein